MTTLSDPEEMICGAYVFEMADRAQAGKRSFHGVGRIPDEGLPVDGRPQRVAGEVLFPETGRELRHILGRVGINPLQDINQVGVGVDALNPAAR